MPRGCSGFERSALNAAAGRFRHLLKQMLPSLTARGAVRDNFVYLKVLRKFAASKRMDRDICTYRDSVCFSCKSGGAPGAPPALAYFQHCICLSIS